MFLALLLWKEVQKNVEKGIEQVKTISMAIHQDEVLINLISSNGLPFLWKRLVCVVALISLLKVNTYSIVLGHDKKNGAWKNYMIDKKLTTFSFFRRVKITVALFIEPFMKGWQKGF